MCIVDFNLFDEVGMFGFRLMLRMIVILQLGLSPVFVYGAEKAQRSKSKTSAQKLVDAKINNFRHRMFLAISVLSSLVVTREDFDKVFLSEMNHRDRKDFNELVKSQKHFPSLRIAGQALVMEQPGMRLEFQWPDLSKKEFVINNKKWTYDPSQPMLPQLKKFQNESNRRGAQHLIDAFIPSADALFEGCVLICTAIAGGVIAITVSAAFQDPINDLICWGRVQVDLAQSVTCAQREKTLNEQRLAHEPRHDAFGNMNPTDATERENVLAKWKLHDISCPTVSNGQDMKYRGRIRAMKLMDNDQRVEDGPWFEVLVKANSNGKTTQIIITKNGMDPESINLKKESHAAKLEVDIPFDVANAKPTGYRVENTDPDKGFSLLGRSPTKFLPPNTEDVKDKVNRARDIVKFLHYRNTACVVENLQAQQDAGVEPAPPPGTVKQ